MADYPISVQVIVDGVASAVDEADWDAGRPVILDGLTFEWGRSSIVDQPDTSEAKFTLRQNLRATGATPLIKTLHTGATVVIKAATATREAVVWMGEIATPNVQQVSDYVVEGQVTCVDTSAYLQNLSIGDAPWPQQTAMTRLQRIMVLISDAMTGFKRPGGYSVRPIYSGDTHLQLMPRDVDAQPAMGMVQDIATSIGGIVWPVADNAGPVLWFEDPTDRPGGRRFQINALTGLLFVNDDLPGDYPRLSAADVQRDIVYTQDPAQSSNLVDVSYQVPSVDTEGETTTDEFTVSWADNAAVSRFGARRLAIETDLVNDTDADALAQKWLTWINTSDEWMISSLPVDTEALTRTVDGYPDADRTELVMDLLDSLTRPGALVGVDDLPTWVPQTQQAYFVEGGSYTWEDGRWKLDLTVTTNGLGTPATAGEMPREVLASDVAPAMTADDIYMARAPERTEWSHNVVEDDQLWFPWMHPNRFPAGTTLENLVSGGGNKAVVTADMNSRRIWFVGEHASSVSGFGPQGDDYLPVKPGEQWEASYMVQLAGNGGTARNMRLQAVYRMAAGGNSGAHYGNHISSLRSVPGTGNHLVKGVYTVPEGVVGVFFAAVGDGNQAFYSAQLWGFDVRRYQGLPDTNIVPDPMFRDPDRNAVRFASVAGEKGTTVNLGGAFADRKKWWMLGNNPPSAAFPTSGGYPAVEGETWIYSVAVAASIAGLTGSLNLQLYGSWGSVQRGGTSFTTTTTEQFVETTITISNIPAGTLFIVPYLFIQSPNALTLTIRKPAARYSRQAGSSNKPRPIPG